jgi:hypothetical protein
MLIGRRFIRESEGDMKDLLLGAGLLAAFSSAQIYADFFMGLPGRRKP